jgi:putative membrane protein
MFKEVFMRETFHYIAAVSVALMMMVTTSVQGQGQTQKGSDAAPSANDRTFLTTAAHGNQAEIELGNLAEKKGVHSEVKSLAAHLVKDHTANLKELQSLASAKKVTLPTMLDKEHQQMKDRLEKLEGASFDKAYAADMVNGHKKMIGLFAQAAKSADAEIKAYAEKTMPTLREHLTHAQKAQAAVGGAASTSGSAPAGAPSTTPR